MEVQCSFTKVKDNLTEIDKKQVGNENEARASRTSKANLSEFNLTEEVKKLKILQRQNYSPESNLYQEEQSKNNL